MHTAEQDVSLPLEPVVPPTLHPLLLLLLLLHLHKHLQLPSHSHTDPRNREVL